ncbi:MAG: hypothetical protein DRN30_02545 [Thermoplasmata archaeon]|nr:hypothetical protein [Euryarchaeota archaeon]RLF66210.1 MAG: hypothetical protein DRN30_02545 [Thermoplasmata archaeon]
MNPVHLAAINLEPGYTEPEITIKIKAPREGDLYTFGYCNLYDLWVGSKRVCITK